MTDRNTIMVVDDNPANVELMYEMLSANYEVIFASSGKEALELATSVLPDLILLDVRMPDMDGYEVCRCLKADPVTMHIPIIFVTALSDSANEEAGLRLGAIDYITKPYSLPILQARIANHLELKRHRDLLANLVWLDGLTGIPNRRHFDEYLEREFRRAVRAQLPLSLIMIDIDHFKLYNDRYGHLAGDECLRQIARSLAKVTRRPSDMLFRYGGEEFSCVLPETAQAGAVKLASAMQEVVHKLAIQHEDSSHDHRVTLSMGVSTFIPTSTQHAADLIAAADYALYRAKALGRNRVEVDN